MSLSEYERQRLENIKQNEALLRTLDIPKTVPKTKRSSSSSKALRKHTPVVKKERQLPTRASARIRGERPTANDETLKRSLDLDYPTESKRNKTIDSLDPEEQAKMLGLLKNLVPNTEPKVKKENQVKQEQDEQGRTPDEVLKNQLASLEIKHTWTTVKVTPSRINGCLFHPSDSKLLACAVDVDGHLGFWDIKQENEEGDPIVYTYKPHTRTITDIHFNPTDDTKLMTSSYDGLIRTFDMNKAEFENLALDSSSWPITSFDLSQDGHSLFFSTSDGDVGFKDIRASDKEHVFGLREKKVGCIHLNPVRNNLLAAASNDRTVSVWDIRMWIDNKKKKGSSIHEFEHGYSATSCYWSPQGDMLATTSYDDYIRLFSLDKNGEMELKSAIKHNNHTGRWVTNFRARWNNNKHQQTTQHLVIGNMKQPIDIYSGETGHEIVQLYDEDHITAIPSVSSFHPSTLDTIILAGNASGRMVCWE